MNMSTNIPTAKDKRIVFLDTSYICALFNLNDSLHEQAKKLVPELVDDILLISNFILLECYTVLSQRVSKKAALKFGRFVRDKSPYDIYWIDKGFEEKIWRIFESIKDKNFSYVDASILAVIKEEKIQFILSFDTYFKKIENKFNFKLLGV